MSVRPVRLMAAVVALVGLAAAAGAGQAPTPEQLPGAANYTRVDAVVACGGATSLGSFDQLKDWGFRAVVNLREAGEPGALVEEEARSVEALGMHYLHIPFSSVAPQAAAVDRFLTALDDPANLPVYVHCATANRVGAMWYAKRVLRDGWPADRAMTEATAIGLRTPALRQFIVGFVETRVK